MVEEVGVPSGFIAVNPSDDDACRRPTIGSASVALAETGIGRFCWSLTAGGQVRFPGPDWPARVWCRSWPPRWRGAHPSGSRSSAPWRRRAGSSRAAGARRGQMRHPASPGRRRSGAGGRSVSPCSRGGGGAHARVFAHYRLDLAEFDSTPRILTCRSVRPSNLNWPFGHQPFIDAVAQTGVGGLHVGSGQVA